MAGQALAQPTGKTPHATSEPASSVHAVDAQLNGVINTAGYATRYQFQWGKSTAYTSATPSKSIPAGSTQAISVNAVIKKLSPATTYHFRLVIFSTEPGKASAVETDGKDLTFKTKPTGRLVLNRTTLPVAGKHATMTFTCDSTIDCTTRVVVATHAKLVNQKKPATVNCISSRFFTIAAHKKATETEAVKAACISLLKQTKHHRLTAKLTANPRTGQHAVIRTVILAQK